MNILPKKSWHVRTRENIARVRKDEAEAAAKAEEEQKRIRIAEREARLNILKIKAKANLESLGVAGSSKVNDDYTSFEKPVSVEHQHINLFIDPEHHDVTTNAAHDKEAKAKREEYEKQIGYLTYLGQDTNESLKTKSWYELPPDATRFQRANDVRDTFNKLVLKDLDGKIKQASVDIKQGEVGWKSKQSLDPIKLFRKHLLTVQKSHVETKKHSSLVNLPVDQQKIKKNRSKHKKRRRESSTDSSDDDSRLLKKQKLEVLRKQRLERERLEREKANKFLAEMRGDKPEQSKSVGLTLKPKYNSQFNPELARQNYR